MFTSFFKTRLQLIFCSGQLFRGVVGCLAWAAALVVLWQCARGPDGVQELARHTPQTPVAECLRLLSIGAHFPSPEVLLPGRRHHCIRVPFDPPRLLNCACRGFLQRRAPIIETQKSPCGAMWTVRQVCFQEKEKICCFVFDFNTATQIVSL